MQPEGEFVGANLNLLQSAALHLAWETHLQIYLHLEFPVCGFSILRVLRFCILVCFCRLNSESEEQGANCGFTTFGVYTMCWGAHL